MSLKHEVILLPVTAIAFSAPYIFVGQGNFLKVYNYDNHTLLVTQRVFKNQAIHGVKTYFKSGELRAILWGGSSIVSVLLQTNPAAILVLSEVFSAADWILDIAFDPTISPNAEFLLNSDEKLEKPTASVKSFDALIISSRNALLQARIEAGSLISIRDVCAASNCLLYAASIIWLSFKHVIIASGTAFGELHVWSYSIETNTKILAGTMNTHCFFTAHDGSIFGTQIVCLPFQDCLVTTCSDDRTIRVWNINAALCPSKSHLTSQKYQCLTQTWAHESRIWKVIALPPKANGGIFGKTIRLVSVGEDATCHKWNLSPDNIKESNGYKLTHVQAYSHHSGKNIWAVALSASPDILFTGGADGQITALNMQDAAIDCDNKISLQFGFEPDPVDAFKTYGFINDTNLIVTTHKGSVKILEQVSTANSNAPIDLKWRTIERIPNLESYSVVATCQSLSISFIGGSNGTVYFFSSTTVSILMQMNRKISGLFAQDLGDGCVTLLIIQQGSPTVELLLINVKLTGTSSVEPVILKSENIFLETGFAVTSSLYVHLEDDQHILVLGSRNGFLGIHGLTNFSQNPKSSTKNNAVPLTVTLRSHGNDTVTSLLWHGSIRTRVKGHNGYLYSTGRDGTYAVHSFSTGSGDTGFVLKCVHQSFLPFGPCIEGMFLRAIDQHLILYGFQSTKFIVWDETDHSEVMKVECGGAHRVWCFQPSYDSRCPNGGTFVWTKASRLKYFRQKDPHHCRIANGGHGREIKACAVSLSVNNNRDIIAYLIATGAEDTDIRIFQYTTSDRECRLKSLQCLRIIRKHNTGIQHLQWSNDGSFLFSSGGMEEFYIWRVQILPLLEIGVVCESACPRISELSDLRIMGFDSTAISHPSNSSDDEHQFIFSMVYSDSTMRVYCYDSKPSLKKWHLISMGSYLNCCLTEARLLSSSLTSDVIDFRRSLLTAGSDGSLIMWTCELPSDDWRKQSVPVISKYCWNHRVHQNSIKCLDLINLSSVVISKYPSYLAITGGDDNAITFTILMIQGHKDITPVSKGQILIVPRAHAASVTGVAVLSTSSPRNFHPPGSLSSKHEIFQVTLATASMDQQLKLWQVSLQYVKDTENGDQWKILDVQRLKSTFTGVADLSGLRLIDAGQLGKDEEGSALSILLCGIGMEVITINLRGELTADN